MKKRVPESPETPNNKLQTPGVVSVYDSDDDESCGFVSAMNIIKTNFNLQREQVLQISPKINERMVSHQY